MTALEDLLIPVVSAIAAAMAAYGGARAQLDSLAKRIDTLDEDVKGETVALNEKIHTASQRIASLENARSEIESRMDRHWSEVQTLRSENGVAHGQIMVKLGELTGLVSVIANGKGSGK